MATRRKIRQKEAQLAFDALTIEGGLLSPEWLARAAQTNAPQQTEADYRVPKGLNLRDEIGRYWRMAQAHWNEFATARVVGGFERQVTERFVLGLLRSCFGFDSLQPVASVVLGDRTFPVGHEALGGRVPVVIAPVPTAASVNGLEVLFPAFGDAGRRRSAFGLAQEYLNAVDSALWGIATDGLTLRIVRDNASLTRPAWIEADLQRIFLEERYADFAALWLILHESRFGRADQPPTDCALEVWRSAGREEGTRAREHLRRGVEDALKDLGQGFLSHPDNVALRAALHDGSLTTNAYFQQLLRLVYRMIFLLTVEERGLLHPDTTPEATRSLYEKGYSLRRLRERAVKRSAHDRYSDLWQGTRIAFRGLVAGEAKLGLPALAGIFAADRCPALDTASLENRALLLAMFRLSWLREASGLSRVNWRDMGPEELGSVYESLLELVPQVTGAGRTFAFATGDETKGNARKTTGSYYTPDSLVQVLLDSALEPVVTSTIGANPVQPAEALLKLTIVDPACGSGHFLLAAARRLASHVARLQANGTPSAAEYRHALRQVVGRCIYGVDLNPMAVELCKVGLWMEAVEPGLPLNFLDAHIQHGNALLGATPELLEKGVPDEAWEPIEGDDRKAASALKKRNKASASGQGSLLSFWASPVADETATVAKAFAELEAASDADLSALSQKEQRFHAILASKAHQHQWFVADAWCAAFVWPKQFGANSEAAPVNDLWQQIRNGEGVAPALMQSTVTALAQQYRFFHWHLAFPQVFGRGGFDVVLGNPPWERVKLQEQEYFASRSEEIANASNASVRKKLIALLPENDPALWTAWCDASREAEGQSHFVRDSGRYPLCGKGDVNTYALFAEHYRAILAKAGALGCILPAGIATDDTTKDFFQAIVSTRTLAVLYHFENEERLFVSVNNMFRFVLLTVTGTARPHETFDVVAFARSQLALADPARRYRLCAAEIAAINPNTQTFPTFLTRRDADINLALYVRAGVVWREGVPDGNPWSLRFTTMLHMANDSGLFRTRAQLDELGQRPVGNRWEGAHGLFVPLLEAKLIHHFDHRYSTHEGATQANLNKGTLPHCSDEQRSNPLFFTTPEYWVDEREVDQRIDPRQRRGWLMGWRNIARSTDHRTMIAGLIPQAAVGHSAPLMFSDEGATLQAALYANLASFVLDYTARQKVGGANVTYGYVRQFPILAPATYAAATPWDPATTLTDWLLPRVLELTYTAWDLQPFAQDVGYDGPPFRWDPARRFLLRCELDAAFFHLYGLNREDTAYILDTFPIVRKNDEKAHGEYRTKRVVLEVFDEMAEAVARGRAYVTRLVPGAADAAVAHAETRTSAKPRA